MFRPGCRILWNSRESKTLYHVDVTLIGIVQRRAASGDALLRRGDSKIIEMTRRFRTHTERPIGPVLYKSDSPAGFGNLVYIDDR